MGLLAGRLWWRFAMDRSIWHCLAGILLAEMEMVSDICLGIIPVACRDRCLVRIPSRMDFQRRGICPDRLGPFGIPGKTQIHAQTGGYSRQNSPPHIANQYPAGHGTSLCFPDHFFGGPIYKRLGIISLDYHPDRLFAGNFLGKWVVSRFKSVRFLKPLL